MRIDHPQTDGLIAESKAEERLSIADLRRGGPPVRVRDLAALTGLSKSKFLAEVKAGKLKATKVRTGTTWRAAIDRPEAYRYLVELGFVA